MHVFGRNNASLFLLSCSFADFAYVFGLKSYICQCFTQGHGMHFAHHCFICPFNVACAFEPDSIETLHENL